MLTLKSIVENMYDREVLTPSRLRETVARFEGRAGLHFSTEYVRTFLANSELMADHSPRHEKFLIRIARGKYITMENYLSD